MSSLAGWRRPAGRMLRLAFLVGVMGLLLPGSAGSSSLAGEGGFLALAPGATLWVEWGPDDPRLHAQASGTPTGAEGARVVGCATDTAGWTGAPIGTNIGDAQGCTYTEHTGGIARTALVCASMGGCSVALSHVDGFDFAGIICGSLGLSSDGLGGVPGPLWCYAYQHGSPPSAWDVWASRVAAQPHPLDDGRRVAFGIHVAQQ